MVRIHSGLPFNLSNLFGNERQSFRIVTIPAIICHQRATFSTTDKSFALIDKSKSNEVIESR